MKQLSRRLSFAALLHMCALAPAAAANWDDGDATRILGDPSFLPVAGQVEGVFSYTYQNDRYDLQVDNTSGSTRAYNRDANSFLPTLRYGITDDITAFADFGWGNSRNQETTTYDRFVFFPQFKVIPTKAQINFRTIGADNPDFGLTWRIIDQRSAPVSVDLTGSYSPDIFKSRAATTLQTGAVASGGQSGSIEAAISREMTMLTLRAYATFSYDGRRNEITQDGFADLRSAPHAGYAAGLEGQVRLLPWLAVSAGVSAQQTMQFDRVTLQDDSLATAPSGVTIKPSGSISPYAGLVVPLVNQHLVGEILYQHDFINNETEDFADGEVQRYFKQQSNVYTARVLFAFGGAPAAMPPPPPAAMAPPGGPVPAPARTYLVFFDWDRAVLSVRARQIVAEAAQASTRQPTTQIEVDGYTDLSGSAFYNQRLSVRRAGSVEAELIRDGVSRSAIAIHGYGESNPLVPTAKGVREPQNRRVEIVLKS